MASDSQVNIGTQTNLHFDGGSVPLDGSVEESLGLKPFQDIKQKRLILAGEFQVRLPNEHSDCNVTGILQMSDNTLLLLDSNNSSLKLLNAERHLVAYMDMHTLPWDVTKISPVEAAISLPNENSILFVSVVPKLHRKRRMTVKDGCFGIAYSNDKLYVGYRELVTVLDMHGSLLMTLSLPGPRLGPAGLSKDVYVLKASPTGCCVIACDRYSGRVSAISPDGKEVFTHYGDSDFEPCGMDMDLRDRVYICDAKSRRVRVLTCAGNVLWDLVIPDSLEVDPRTVALCEDTQQIIVSGICSDTIRVFEAKGELMED